MSTDHAIEVRGIKVQVVRKAIKNLHLGVYPPNGRVRVAAPMAVSNDAVRLAIIGKLGWIGRQRRKFLKQPRQSKREMVSGESHYFRGRRYRLRIVEEDGVPHVKLRQSVIELHVRPASSAASREAALDTWYRQQLRELTEPLFQKWETRLGVEASEWNIKKMRTKWGSCNAKLRRVWLNLELAKTPVACLEYLVVHELVHLLSRRHDEFFFAQMDRHLPNWRSRRELLNSHVLPHVVWPC